MLVLEVRLLGAVSLVGHELDGGGLAGGGAESGCLYLLLYI